MAEPLKVLLSEYKKGAYIIVEGKPRADYFYIIRSGKVSISKEVELVQEEDPILKSGDFFGIVSTMGNYSRIETAQALTDVSLIGIHREQYEQLIKNNTSVAIKIIQVFSKKVRHLNEALAKISGSRSSSRGPEHLYEIGTYYAENSKFNQAYYAFNQYLEYLPDGVKAGEVKEKLEKIEPYAKVVKQEEGQGFARTYPKDTMIFCEGEPGQEMYIIQKGSVRISGIRDGRETLYTILHQSDIFGEMSLLEDKPRSASAEAHEDAVLLAINKSNFEAMASRQPEIISRLTRMLAERIWAMYRQLANRMIEDKTGRLYDALLLHLQKSRVPFVRKNSYKCDFGPDQLMSMAGLSAEDGNPAIRKLFEDKNFKLIENNIHITDVEEVRKQAEYYIKMEKISKARKAKRSG